MACGDISVKVTANSRHTLRAFIPGDSEQNKAMQGTRKTFGKSEHLNRRLRLPWRSSSDGLQGTVRAMEAPACHLRDEQKLGSSVQL